MNKKRLIDANAASLEIERTRRQMLDTRLRIGGAGDWLNGYTDGLEAVAEFIKQAPTVDAVEVVRCKECKEMIEKGWCSLHYTPMTRIDFCSYGERREDDACNFIPGKAD